MTEEYLIFGWCRKDEVELLRMNSRTVEYQYKINYTLFRQSNRLKAVIKDKKFFTDLIHPPFIVTFAPHENEVIKER